MSFAKMFSEFKNRNCNLLGLSIDSNPSHLAWITNIYRSSGIEIPFPVIADLDMKISKLYGMIAPNSSNTQTIRSVFFIDPNQIIRAKLEYPLTNGRNISEILRLLEAMQLTDSKHVLTPANWLPGNPAIVPAPKTYKELIERQKNENKYSCMDWYLCFLKPDDNLIADMNESSANTQFNLKNIGNKNYFNDSNINIINNKK